MCQRIGMFRKVLPCLLNFFAILYYYVFIRSCFSYCLMFWFNKDFLGRYKLINKIERIISSLAANNNQTVNDFK